MGGCKERERERERERVGGQQHKNIYANRKEKQKNTTIDLFMEKNNDL